MATTSPRSLTVTVVIPTYKRPELLHIAITSVLNQTFESFRLVVSDDDAAPEVEDLVDSYGDPRVSYQANVPRLGQALNPLLPMSRAGTDLVACLQDDDEWEPSLLAMLVPRLAEDPEIVVAFADHSLMDAHGLLKPDESDRNSRRWGRATLRPGKHKPFLDLGVVHQTVPAMMTAVIRRDAVRWDLPEEIATVSDLWLGYLLARTGGAAWYEPMRLGRYRSHDASATARAGSAQTRCILFCYDRFLEDPGLASVWPALRKRRDAAAIELGLSHLREEHWAAGRRTLARSLRSGVTRRGAAGLLLSLAPRPIARAALGKRRHG